MSAGLYNFTIEQSIGFTTVFQWTEDDAGQTPIDLTGLEPKMQIRSDKSKNARLIADLTSYLTMEPEEGRVTLAIPGAVTDLYDFDTGYYSLRLSNSARLIEGMVTLSRETSA